MPQAIIEVNGVIGSNTDLPINTLVQLSNDDAGDETTYLWTILDQPPGPVDNLSATNIENPTFTPRKEGTYLIELVVDNALPSEVADRVVCSVRQLKTRARVPAAGEDEEADPADGWAISVNEQLRALDALRADPNIIVARVDGAPVLSRGMVVRLNTGVAIKVGLPGQERIVGCIGATLSSLGLEDLGVVEGNVTGAPTATTGDLVYVRIRGVMRDVGIAAGAPAVGGAVYLAAASAMSGTVGTLWRRLGLILSSSGAGIFDVALAGLDSRVTAMQNHFRRLETIAADQNDFIPGNWPVVDTLIIDPTGADRNITGFGALDGTATRPGQRRKFVWNRSLTLTAIIPNEGAGSTAINRVLTPGAISFRCGPRSGFVMEYDIGEARWVIVNPTPGGSVPLTPLPTGYMNGLVLNRLSTNVVEASVGSCRSSDDTFNIVTTGLITASLSAAGANGLDTGVEAASTWYHFYVIADSTGVNPPAGLWSLSATAPTMPVGYDKRRRLGAWRNNASSNLLNAFMMTTGRSRLFLYDEEDTALIVLSGGTSTAFALVLLGALVPPTSQLVDLLVALNTNAAGNNVAIKHGLSTVTVPAAKVYGPALALSTAINASAQLRVRTDASQQIAYRNTAATDDTSIWVLGYQEEI